MLQPKAVAGAVNHGFTVPVLEHYRLISRLACGGMAEVFLATCHAGPSAPPLVVIKRLHDYINEDRGARQMLADEARVALRLQHPNIVRTFEVGFVDGRLCIAMEYLRGQTLQRIVRHAREGGERLPLEFCAAVVLQALAGLNYAHAARAADGSSLQIVHRDVSPHNLLLTYDGELKVLDFGVAKATCHEARTTTGLIKGKVGYMAPEQARAESVDRRADLWSLGVVLWELISGERLFKAANDAATLHMALTAPVPSLSSRRLDVPQALQRVVDRALQRDPTQRYASAAEMQRDLGAWLQTRPVGTEILAAYMKRHFAAEIVADNAALLSADSTYAPPSTSWQPSSSATPGGTAFASQNTTVSVLLDELTKRDRRAKRMLWGLLAVVTSAAVVLAYINFARRTPSNAHLVAPPVAAAAAAPTAEQQPAAVALVPTIDRVPSSTDYVNSPATGARRPVRAARPTRPAPAASSSATIGNVEPEYGYLTIDTVPWSQVSAGSIVLGQTPVVAAKLPVGSHLLRLHNAELGISSTYQVTISAGRTTTRRIGLE